MLKACKACMTRILHNKHLSCHTKSVSTRSDSFLTYNLSFITNSKSQTEYSCVLHSVATILTKHHTCLCSLMQHKDVILLQSDFAGEFDAIACANTGKPIFFTGESCCTVPLFDLHAAYIHSCMNNHVCTVCINHQQALKPLGLEWCSQVHGCSTLHAFSITKQPHLTSHVRSKLLHCVNEVQLQQKRMCGPSRYALFRKRIDLMSHVGSH